MRSKILTNLKLKVYSDGRVFDLLNNNFLREYVNNCGYNFVVFIRNKKRHHQLVHRLVAIAFIPNPNNLSDVNHIDENKLNNNVSNLEWMSHADNLRYSRNKRPINCEKIKNESLIRQFINNLSPKLNIIKYKTKNHIVIDGIEYDSYNDACIKLGYTKARISQFINVEGRGYIIPTYKYYWNHLDSKIIKAAN